MSTNTTSGKLGVLLPAEKQPTADVQQTLARLQAALAAANGDFRPLKAEAISK